MRILLDAGHGIDTLGKRSPDGLFWEYAYTREIAALVAAKLRKEGYDAELLVPELYDIKLLERVHRANVKCQTYGASNVLLVSIHCNAAGSGKEWMNGRGWEAWTSKGQTEGDKLAECLYESALETFAPGTKIRSDWGDGDYDKENQFTILSKTDFCQNKTCNCGNHNGDQLIHQIIPPLCRFIVDSFNFTFDFFYITFHAFFFDCKSFDSSHKLVKVALSLFYLIESVGIGFRTAFDFC